MQTATFPLHPYLVSFSPVAQFLGREVANPTTPVDHALCAALGLFRKLLLHRVAGTCAQRHTTAAAGSRTENKKRKA